MNLYVSPFFIFTLKNSFIYNFKCQFLLDEHFLFFAKSSCFFNINKKIIRRNQFKFLKGHSEHYHNQTQQVLQTKGRFLR